MFTFKIIDYIFLATICILGPSGSAAVSILGFGCEKCMKEETVTALMSDIIRDLNISSLQTIREEQKRVTDAAMQNLFSDGGRLIQRDNSLRQELNDLIETKYHKHSQVGF